MQKTNVLIFPCGTEIGLELNAALKFEKNVRLFGASSILDHGEMVFQNYTPDLPFINSPAFISAFNAIIREKKIQFIFPAHDDVVLFLSRNAEKIDATIITSPADVCGICRFKSKTYKYFSGHDFVPTTYQSPGEISTYPVFLKPDQGQGSHGVVKADNESECLHAIKNNPDLIICEYLPGEEYTVDCYTDKLGQLLFVGPRIRSRTKAGISVSSKSFATPENIKSIAFSINDKLDLQGAWFFQLKQSKNKDLKLLEIAPRIAGTMATNRVKGINFALLSLFEAQGKSISINASHTDIQIERALTNRYNTDIAYSTVFMDLDDTLIINGAVCAAALQFIYQCKDRKIPVHLITRHYREPSLTLDELAIHSKLFHDVIWIQGDSAKSEYMCDVKNPIFFDDSFKERQDAVNAGVPSFAPDSLEMFIDWRV